MKYDNKFEDFYNDIRTKETNFLEDKKRKAKKEKDKNSFIEIFLLVLGIVLYVIFDNYCEARNIDKNFVILLELLYFAAMLIIITYKKEDKQHEYSKEFKNRVIKKMIVLFDKNNLTYHPEGAIDPYIYDKADFEKYDRYNSDDFISGKVKNNYTFIMSDVKTENKYKDRNGHTKYKTIFSGLFVSVDCPKDFTDSLYIRSNKDAIERVLVIKSKYKKLKLELDSKEFENEFDVYSSNKIIAMQLLTADIMEMLVKFKKEIDMNYEITIKDNHIYYRFLCGKLFETNDLNEFSLDKDMLYKYYKIIDFSLILSEKLTELVKDTEY